MVFIKDIASAPPFSAAFAISLISVTFGVSFMIIGRLDIFFIFFVICSTKTGSVPNESPPFSTLGHEILISYISISASLSFSMQSRYSF